MSEFSGSDSLFHLGPPRGSARTREGGVVVVVVGVGSAFESKNTPRAPWWKTEDHLDRITGGLGGTQTGQRGVGLTFGGLSISVNTKAL